MTNTYKIRVAMSPRAYGSITVEGNSPEEAINSVDASMVAERFEPHGGSGDLDYGHPTDIWLADVTNEDGEEVEGGDVERDVPDGPWIYDAAKVLLKPLLQFEVDDDGDLIIENGQEFLDSVAKVFNGYNSTELDQHEIESAREKHSQELAEEVGIAQAESDGIAAEESDEEPLVVRVAYETMQFFEVDVPDDEDPELYCDTKEGREHLASLILSGFIDFKIERKFGADGEEL